MSECSSCHSERGDLLTCPACEALQPLSVETNYFAALGLERRMSIAREELDRAFRTISKKVHPDRFPRDEPEQRRRALQLTELVNVAYRTLKEPQKRAEYLLELAGHQVATETERTLDTEFLLALLEKQEQVQDASDSATVADLKQETRSRSDELLGQVTRFFDENGEAQGSSSLATVDEVRMALIELRYLRRMLDQIVIKEEELL